MAESDAHGSFSQILNHWSAFPTFLWVIYSHPPKDRKVKPHSCSFTFMMGMTINEYNESFSVIDLWWFTFLSFWGPKNDCFLNAGFCWSGPDRHWAALGGQETPRLDIGAGRRAKPATRTQWRILGVYSSSRHDLSLRGFQPSVWIYFWLVVSTYPTETYESQLGLLFSIYGKSWKHVPNHHPDLVSGRILHSSSKPPMFLGSNVQWKNHKKSEHFGVSSIDTHPGTAWNSIYQDAPEKLQTNYIS